jgi:hypothetical protein
VGKLQGLNRTMAGAADLEFLHHLLQSQVRNFKSNPGLAWRFGNSLHSCGSPASEFPNYPHEKQRLLVSFDPEVRSGRAARAANSCEFGIWTPGANKGGAAINIGGGERRLDEHLILR